MKKQFLCTLLCFTILLGMIPCVPLVTVAETASGILIANLPRASDAKKDDGIRAYKIDSVDELIAAASTERVGVYKLSSDSSYSAACNYVHDKYVESDLLDRGDYSTFDTIYITEDLDIAAWIAANPDQNFADLYDGFNANKDLYTTLTINLDGQGHTITGFTDTHALFFGRLIGSVKNLTIADATIDAAL